MTSIAQITQRLNNLSIEANAFSSTILNEANEPVSSETSTQPTQSLEAPSAQHVDMGDASTLQDADIIDNLVNRAANLSVERHQPMRLATLTARFRESSEARRRLQAIARQNTALVASSPTATTRASRPATSRSLTSNPSPSVSPTLGRRHRRHARPSLTAGDHDASPLFRSRAQVHRATIMQRRQAALEARLSHELHLGNLTRAQAAYAQLEAAASAAYVRSR
ncbi:hypothetical protein B0T20DRAFT_397566 [Sordaria brevicollis]|uniref:Uncharacterized protein n=1 Tax=Sordaria brevicollis TaxID=83679 RepID=A0AAE0NW06_SORBR|nr:hypothetical protein B0T20DRAFT_397566 [Sordaria brevicollis]